MHCVISTNPSARRASAPNRWVTPHGRGTWAGRVNGSSPSDFQSRGDFQSWDWSLPATPLVVAPACMGLRQRVAGVIPSGVKAAGWIPSGVDAAKRRERATVGVPT
jgi:hypothetical protein